MISKMPKRNCPKGAEFINSIFKVKATPSMPTVAVSAQKFFVHHICPQKGEDCVDSDCLSQVFCQGQPYDLIVKRASSHMANQAFWITAPAAWKTHQLCVCACPQIQQHGKMQEKGLWSDHATLRRVLSSSLSLPDSLSLSGKRKHTLANDKYDIQKQKKNLKVFCQKVILIFHGRPITLYLFGNEEGQLLSMFLANL